MKYSDIHPIFRETLGVFEALRKLGFSADDIFFGTGGLHPTEGYQFAIMLETQNKSFTVIAGFIMDTPENIKRDWTKVANSIMFISQDDLDRIWRESSPFKHQDEFCNAIKSKDIMIPNTLN